MNDADAAAALSGLNPADRELLAAVVMGMVWRDRFGVDWRWSWTPNGSPEQVAAADLRRLDGLIYLREGQGAEPIWDVTPAALETAAADHSLPVPSGPNYPEGE